MSKKATISYIGIEQNDMRVVRSLFQLVKWLQKVFMLRMLRPGIDAEILLVNADSKEALSQWRIVKSEKNYISVMLSDSGQQFKDTFTIQRPIVPKQLERVLEKIASMDRIHRLHEDVLSDSLDVLVVDDSLPVRQYMEQKLPQLYSSKVIMDFASSGEEAAKKVKQNIYDIIFLDVVMPGVDGYKVCKWIKANSVAHVVMLTSKGSPIDKVRGAMSGCHAYLVKPPEDKNLKSIMDNYSIKAGKHDSEPSASLAW